MNAKQWNETLKWHTKALATDNTRPVLNYVYATPDHLVSANGYALHVTRGDFRNHADARGFIAHKHTLNTDGLRFPDWQALIPRETRYCASFTVGQMVQAVKTARVFSKHSNESTAFVLNRNDAFIAVVGRSLDHGDASSNVAAQHVQAPDAFPLVFALNAAFVLDALSGFNVNDVITLRSNGAAHPVVIGTDARYALIMPMNAAYEADHIVNVLKLVDPTLPTDYSPVRTWKQSEQDTRKRLKARNPSLFGSKPRKAASKRDPQVTEVERGAVIPLVGVDFNADVPERDDLRTVEVSPINTDKLTLTSIRMIAHSFQARPYRDGVILYDPHKTQGAVFILPDGNHTRVTWRQHCDGAIETNLDTTVHKLFGEVLTDLLADRQPVRV